MGHGAALATGTIFANDYRIVRPLASGGMGAVYVAEQLSTGKLRALKLMHAELAWDARLRDRFVQEARVGANIDSEHVVEVVGAGIDQATGMPWLSMELLEGVDLATMVQQRGPLPVAEVREILSQLCHALAAAHRSGIVHRDLKPQNIFIARSRQQNVSYRIKVLDFGIAKVVAAARGTSAATAVVGTPLWMAPEQTDANGVVSPASDVWAIGLIVFRMLTGRWYWLQAAGEASSVMTLMREVLFEPIVPASARAAQLGMAHLIPPGFDGWFARCVDRDPRMRFPDAGQAMQAFQSALPDSSLGGVAHSALQVPIMQAAQPSYGQPMPMLQTTGQAAMAATGPSGVQTTNGMGVGVVPRKKQGIPPFVWLVGAVIALLLFAGVLVLGLALVGVGLDAANQTASVAEGDLSGRYEIADSSNPGGGGRYYGHVSVQRVVSTYRLRWEFATGAPNDGVGLVVGDLFGVGYAQGGDFALAIYEVRGGTLQGAYTTASHPGSLGAETLVGPAGLSGRYRLTQSTDGLSGEVTIQPHGSSYLLSRSAAAGGHAGTGLVHGDKLVVTWTQAVIPGGVVAYGIRNGVLEGRWAPLKSPVLGTETLRRQ